jgi:EAL domain-containing protein (putative c-di-GMP-specific phosphodiesterase class I)
MDDFGNGFSSLNMLKDIPVDVIKIDMMFLDETRDSEKAEEILKSIVSLAKRLRLPVITEGVETKEQLQFLSGIGCDLYQGYYYARAVPIPEFEDRYMRKGDGRIIRET